jgi:ABC-type multidrug transport system fused ATPase/permease subunit
MLASVLRAPLSYFESQPQGRILSRFTYDMEVVDVILTQNLAMFMVAMSWFFAGVVLMSSILNWMILALLPVTFLYWLLLLHYRKSGVDLQRLDALSRSPIQAMVTEVLDGSPTIRVFKREPIFVERFRVCVDRNSSGTCLFLGGPSCGSILIIVANDSLSRFPHPFVLRLTSSTAMLNFISAQRWLGVRIELLGSLVVLVSSVLVVCLNETLRLEPGIVGLLTVWSSNFTLSLGFLIDFFGESEAAITAVERIDAMKRLPAEKEMETDAKYIPPTSWPEEGAIEFKDVCLRYREGLPLALNNLSFRIPPGKSCGVVGRTGAGKSSLSVALFRIVEIESGRILLDGRDLGQLGLSDVRGRPEGMSIIPQDPFLAGSTLRECIDPLGKSSDESVLEALRAVRMASADDTVAELASVVEEGGSNYSVGERQLINLARALLSKPKVLVLDEATAATVSENVYYFLILSNLCKSASTAHISCFHQDGETDAFIQRMLRTRFKDTTLFTVAHRLHTIMDYDLALVMDQGSAVELGSPAELLSNASGTFSELVNATGLESAKALRAMAKGDVANHPS